MVSEGLARVIGDWPGVDPDEKKVLSVGAGVVKVVWTVVSVDPVGVPVNVVGTV